MGWRAERGGRGGKFSKAGQAGGPTPHHESAGSYPTQEQNGTRARCTVHREPPRRPATLGIRDQRVDMPPTVGNRTHRRRPLAWSAQQQGLGRSRLLDRPASLRQAFSALLLGMVTESPVQAGRRCAPRRTTPPSGVHHRACVRCRAFGVRRRASGARCRRARGVSVRATSAGRGRSVRRVFERCVRLLTLRTSV